jgi:hypothetical protein
MVLLYLKLKQLLAHNIISIRIYSTSDMSAYPSTYPFHAKYPPQDKVEHEKPKPSVPLKYAMIANSNLFECVLQPTAVATNQIDLFMTKNNLLHETITLLVNVFAIQSRFTLHLIILNILERTNITRII